MEKIRVLLVEDELIIAASIKKRLEKLGYRVPGIATSGQEAVQKAKDLHPDVILMEIQLGGDMDGIEAAKQIRILYRIPVVFLTAYTDTKTLSRAKITEPYGYIIKPVEDHELQSNIEIAVYKHLMETQLLQYRSQLNNIIGNASNVIISIDQTHRIFLWNKTIERITGVRQRDIMRKRVEECGVFSDPKLLAEEIDAVFHGKKVSLQEICIRDINGVECVLGLRHSFLTQASDTDLSLVLLAEDITAEQKRHQELLKGRAYISFERPPLTANHPFFSLTRTDSHGLLMTRVNSPETLFGLPLEGVQVRLIKEMKRGPEAVSTLEEMLAVIKEFIRHRKNCVILLSRVDYLISRFSFDEFLRFIYKATEAISETNAILFVQADPVFFSERERALLSHELHVLPSQVEAPVEIDDSLVAILRYVYEQNQSNVVVSFKKIRMKFVIAYSTTTIKLRMLESLGLVFVKKYGRSKAVYITEKGRQALAGKSSANMIVQ